MNVDIIQEGARLRLVDNPGVRGRATGRMRPSGSFTMVEIELGPNDRKFYRSTQLEDDVESVSPDQLFSTRAFGRPDDLRRILSLSRMTGALTNVLYSMESSNTDFLPHQYKPVLKFIESPTGRLLIADEVGLGKTIEAVYIWQELQARIGARRLLVVCPSVLRDKWKHDLMERFGIDDVALVDAKALLGIVETVARGNKARSFVAIASLEGLRVREDYADPLSSSPRERLAGILKENGDNDGDFIFDLVVIDEAHYLRNAATASHQAAAMLRDASRNLVLLSATPLQTAEENLFSLLKLLAPEYFNDPYIFLRLYASNAAIVRASNAVLYDADPDKALALIDKALQDDQFRDAPALMRARRAYEGGDLPALEDRISLGRSLEALSLFGAYYTRSRKRDVFPDRVVRSAHHVSVGLDPYEISVYEAVSSQIRDRARSGRMVESFRLTSRQRQLASSFYASLRKWRQGSEDPEEELWEDLGLIEEEIERNPAPSPMDLDLDFDLPRLRAIDTKYREFSEAMKRILGSDHGEKIVVFSYYRATISYLVERLGEDGITAMPLVGGMGEERWKAIERFRDDTTVRVLVSSEVGSEGIDLQFCRYLFNYDLPWNPMRLEQRIGRLDRIGQKADKILIYNLHSPDTIEDRVIMRLYERIEIFRRSIGDLEDILGRYMEAITAIMLDPGLTQEERDDRLKQSEQALIEQRHRNAELEERSIDLLGHGEKVLQSIERSHDMRRWVGHEDIISLVRDFFSIRYPQTQFRDGKVPGSLSLELSGEARASLLRFIDEEKPVRGTALATHDKPVLCLFDPRTEPPRAQGRWERVSTFHPLVRWIVSEYGRDRAGLHPVSAIVLSRDRVGLHEGAYAYMIQRWSAHGIKAREEQRFFALHLGEEKIFEGDEAEFACVMAAEQGLPWHEWTSEIDEALLEEAQSALFSGVGRRFERFIEEFEGENETLCDRQERFIGLSFERRRDGIKELIERLSAQGKQRVIPMHQGRLRSLEKELERKMAQVAERRKVESDFADVSMGILRII